MAVLSKSCAASLLLPLLAHGFTNSRTTSGLNSYSSQVAPALGQQVNGRTTYLKMAEETEVERLQRQAREAREAAAKLNAELEGYKAANPQLAVAEKAREAAAKGPERLTFDQVLDRLGAAPVDGSGAAAAQLEALGGLKADGVVNTWKSKEVTSYAVTIGRMTSATGIEGKDLSPLEGGNEDDLRWSLVVVCLGSFILAAGSGIVIGGNVGATLTYLFAVIPILFLGVGSTAPGIITSAIEGFKTNTDSDFNERRIRHEAAHFLVGYALGFPIRSYTSEGPACEVEFYDTPAGDDFAAARTAEALKKEQLEPLAVVAMSGAVGECLEFGNARGGQNDLVALQTLFTRTRPYVRADEQMSLTRWGVVEAHKVLTQNRAAYEALVQAFREKRSVQECIAIIESTK